MSVKSLKIQSSLVQEELVRQIRNAKRWSAVVEAWEALIKVRWMANNMIKEQEMFESDNPAGSSE